MSTAYTISHNKMCFYKTNIKIRKMFSCICLFSIYNVSGPELEVSKTK